MPAATNGSHHVQLATNIAHSLSGSALDQMDTVPDILTTVPSSKNKRRSTVFQRRISTDQFTLAGRIMHRRDHFSARNERSRSMRRTRSVSADPLLNRKVRGRSQNKTKSRSLPRMSDNSRFGQRNDEFERKVERQSRITSIFGDWKHKVWKRSQYRAFSI